jgi:capsular exopolysaccharide synthesis family protein
MQEDQRLTPAPRTAEHLSQHRPEEISGYAPYYDEDSLEGQRSIRQYIDIVKKRLPMILALTLVATTAAAFYMFSLPSRYSAQTTLVIEPRKPKVASKDSININFGVDQNYYQTQLQLLQSPELMQKVVTELGIYDQPGILGKGRLGVGDMFRSLFSSQPEKTETVRTLPVITADTINPAAAAPKAAPELTPEQQARISMYAGILRGGMSVTQRERTNLVDISVTSDNPEISAAAANMVAKVFQDEDAEREMSGTQQEVTDLRKSIDELQTTISQQESQLIQDMSASGLPLADKGQDLAASRLQAMSQAWLTASEQRRQIEGRYNAAVAADKRGEGMNIPDLYENKIYQDTMRLNTERKAKLQDQIRDIEKQIQETEAEMAELLVKYTTEYAPVKAKQERIATLKATKEKTEKEVSQIIERDQKKIEKDAVAGALVALRSQLEAARKQEAQSLAVYEREAALANIQGQAQTKLTTQKRDIETNRNLLDNYTQRLKERELNLASGRPDNIKIAMSATPSNAPVGPRRSRNILVAFLLSLAGGIGLAFLLDYLDDSVKSSEDVGRHLGLPTLALIPHHNMLERKKHLLTPKLTDGGNGSNGATSMIALSERHSPMAEAYRHLRTSLLFSSAGKPPQTILVTSSQPSEGKTTTAINTAITLAQSGVDVIIVDCDLRRPRLHSNLGLENSHGLTNYLSGERNTANMIKSCPGLPRLKVITSGPIPPNPAELLSSNEMKNLLQFLRGRYNHVIVDSPPAISFTDAAILSTLVDGVVLVAMAGKSSIHLMRRFKQRLSNIGARIYGVVLNGIRSGSVEYDYYGSGYYDYYGKASDDTSTPVMAEAESIHDTRG